MSRDFEMIEKGLLRLIALDPFWGRLAQDIVWKKDNSSPFPMGVGLTKMGFQGVYNPEVIRENKYDDPATISEIIKHELWHIILRHPFRWYSNVDHMTQNIAMDMVVNGTKSNPRIKLNGDFIFNKDEWEDDTFDEILEHLMKDCLQCPVFQNIMKQLLEGNDQQNKGNSQGQQDGDDSQQGGGGSSQQDGDDSQQGGGGSSQQDGDDSQQGGDDSQQGGGGSSQQDQHDNSGDNDNNSSSSGGTNSPKNLPHKCGHDYCPWQHKLINDHKFMKDITDLDESEYNQTLKDHLEQAVKDAGSAPGGIETIIEELGKSKVNWKKLLKIYQGRYIGGKIPTLKRPNRRIKKFGIKGRTKKSHATLTIFADESLSISDEENKQIFAEIDKVSSYYKVTLAIWSVGITAVYRYRKGMWKKVINKGRGGTDLDLTLDQAEEQGLIGQCNIILTDGEFYSEVKERKYPIIWVITTDTPAPSWAKEVIRLKV